MGSQPALHERGPQVAPPGLARLEAAGREGERIDLETPLSQAAGRHRGLAEHYLVAHVRMTRAGDHLGPYYLLRAARIYARHHLGKEAQIALWRGVVELMEVVRGAASPDYTEGWAQTELGRACRAHGRSACARRHFTTAVEIFGATACHNCLDEVAPELDELADDL